MVLRNCMDIDNNSFLSISLIIVHYIHTNRNHSYPKMSSMDSTVLETISFELRYQNTIKTKYLYEVPISYFNLQ